MSLARKDVELPTSHRQIEHQNVRWIRILESGNPIEKQ